MAKTPGQLNKIIEFVRNDGQPSDSEMLNWCDKHKGQLYVILKDWLNDYIQPWDANLREMIDKNMEE